MSDKVAIDLIAKRCGVSKSTVSRVLNQRPYVKEEVQKRVLQTMQELNYAPRQMAVKKVVAIAVAGIGCRMGLYEAALVSGLTGHLMRRGLSVRIHPTEDFVLDRAFDVRCVITTSLSHELSAMLKLTNGVQGILINSVEEGYHSVRSDHAQGISLAVERLASLGHRRIGFLIGCCSGWGNSERTRGYREAVASLSLDSSECLIQNYGSSLVEGMAKLLLASPTAVIVSGEDSAIEANYSLRILGRRIPEDISLVTFENVSISRCMCPPNSTIDQGIEQISAAAADLAARIVDGETMERPLEIVSLNKFVERESTRRLQ